MIFGTVFGQSRTGFGFGFDPGIDVFGFFGVFWYHSKSVMIVKGPRSVLFYMGPRFGLFYVLCIVGK